MSTEYSSEGTIPCMFKGIEADLAFRTDIAMINRGLENELRRRKRISRREEDV